MRSLWNENVCRPGFPALKGDIKTDVLIIGGGIRGILTAYFLQKKGVPYILVEKGNICGGTTGNTTAKITFQHGLVYSKILRSCGLEKAQMYLQANRAAFEKYAELCKNIDCEYEIKNNYVYSADDGRKLGDEINALSKIGYNAVFSKDIPLPIKTEGAVCFEDQAQFHPLKFLFSIAKGLNIYEHTFVQEMIGTTAVTNCGKIRAGKVIVTTHFPFINKHGSYFLKLYQHRSYVIALENAQNVNGMYVDECKTGYSFRNYENLLLLGGGGHRTGKDGGNWNERNSKPPLAAWSMRRFSVRQEALSSRSFLLTVLKRQKICSHRVKRDVRTLAARLNGIPPNIHGTAPAMVPALMKTERYWIILQTEI